MGKIRSWLSLVNRLLIPEGKSKEEKKSKRWRWVFGRLKLQQYPALTAPQRTISEVNEEQRKHALAVAIATAAAAEAAVAAAHAAAEVVRLTGFPDELGKRNRNLAAIKIQSVYRGHLARKALMALKGIVRLQAVVRGQIVRCRVSNKLRCLQSVVNTHTQVHHIRVPTANDSCKYGEKKQILTTKELEDKEIKLERNNDRNWDYHLFSREDTEDFWLRKQEAIIKRDRMKKYSLSNRENRNAHTLEKLLTNKEDGRLSHRFEEWASIELCRRRETKKSKTSILSNLTDSATYGKTQLKLRNTCKHDSIEESNSPVSLPRRSFCHAKKQESSVGHGDCSLPNSPVFPTYMAATESAKAKARSMSTPKQRLGFLDVYSVHSSQYNPKLSSWSSFNSELTSTNEKSGTSQNILRRKVHCRD